MSNRLFNKQSIAKLLSKHMNWTQKFSLEFIDLCFDWIKEKMQCDYRVILSGFGSFQYNERKPRQVIHPQTKQRMTIPQRKSPHFSPASTLIKQINKEGLS